MCYRIPVSGHGDGKKGAGTTIEMGAGITKNKKGSGMTVEEGSGMTENKKTRMTKKTGNPQISRFFIISV